jgi:uncharacterized protein YdeI (YjbR/CyaY-like superfamily)
VLRFTTKLVARGPAAAVILDDEQVALLGQGAKTFPVLVTIRGQTLAFRLARMGGENLIGLRREVRIATGVEEGDTVDLEIALDRSERAVELPSDLAEALAAAGGRASFDALAPSRRKDHARRVTEAKRPETRARRVADIVAEVTSS